MKLNAVIYYSLKNNPQEETRGNRRGKKRKRGNERQGEE